MSNQKNKIPYDEHYDILNNVYSSEKIFIDNLILGLKTQFLKYELNNYELDFILKNQKDEIKFTKIDKYPFSVLEAHLNACIAEAYLNNIDVDNALKYKKPSYKKKIWQKGGAEGGHIGAILFHDGKLWKALPEINKLKDFEVTYSIENLPENLTTYLNNKNYQKGGDVKIDKQLFQSGLKPIDFKNEDGKYNCVKLEEKSIEFPNLNICQEGTFNVLTTNENNPRAPPVQPPTNTTKEIECGPGEKLYNCDYGPICGDVNVQPEDCIISLDTNKGNGPVEPNVNYATVDTSGNLQTKYAKPIYSTPVPNVVCNTNECKKGKFIVDAEYFFYCKLHILNKKTSYDFIKKFFNITTLPLLFNEDDIYNTVNFFHKDDLIKLEDLKYPYYAKLLKDEKERGGKINSNGEKFLAQYNSKYNEDQLLELYKKNTNGSDSPKYYYEIGNLRIKEGENTGDWAEEIYDYKIGLYTKNHFDYNINASRHKDKVKGKVINQLLLDGIATSFRYGFRLEGLGNNSEVEKKIKDSNSGYIYLKRDSATPKENPDEESNSSLTSNSLNTTKNKKRPGFLKRIFRTKQTGGNREPNNIKPKRTKKRTTSSNVQVGKGAKIKERLSSNYYQLNTKNILNSIQTNIYDNINLKEYPLKEKKHLLPLLHLLHINPFLLNNKSISTFHKLNPDKKENRPLYSIPPILTLYEIINHMKSKGCLKSYQEELTKIYDCYFNTHKLQNLETNPICGFIGSSIMISHKPETERDKNNGKVRIRLSDFGHPYFIHKQGHDKQIVEKQIVEKQIFINFILGLYKFLFYNYLLINIVEKKKDSFSTNNKNTLYGVPTDKIRHLLESIHEILITYKNIYPEYQEEIKTLDTDAEIRDIFKIPISSIKYKPPTFISKGKLIIPQNITTEDLIKNLSLYSKGEDKGVYGNERLQLDRLIYLQKQNILLNNLAQTEALKT